MRTRTVNNGYAREWQCPLCQAWNDVELDMCVCGLCSFKTAALCDMVSRQCMDVEVEKNERD